MNKNMAPPVRTYEGFLGMGSGGSDSEPEMEAGSPHLSDEEGHVHMVRPEEIGKVIVSLNPSTSSAANTLPAVAEEK